MAVGLVPYTPGSSQPTSSFSYPDRASLAFFDDGGGGSLGINGLGVTGVGFLDLKTWFATTNNDLFRSVPLLAAFRKLRSNTDYAALAQLTNNIELQINAISTPVLAPGFSMLAGLGGNDYVPFLSLNGPGAVGLWRVDIKLRHTLVG